VRFRPTPRCAATVAALLLVASCADDRSTPSNAGDGPTETEAPSHGYVEGAEETAEAQVGLAFAEAGRHEVSILDLATEQTAVIPLALAAATMAEDGRYLYVGDGGSSIEIVDTGVWTVDHVDHVHYYRAPATSHGVVTLDAPVVSVVGHGPHTAIGTADGTVTILDRAALDGGEPPVIAELETDAATPFAVPFDGDLLLATATGIVTVDANGEPTGAAEAPCAGPSGWAILRSGVAIGCDDGVLLVKRPERQQQTFFLPYPASAPRATAFEYRPRSNEAAAVAGADGVWSVDANHERLAFVPVGGGDVIAAASPADERHVVSLGADGTMHLSSLDGVSVATAEVLPPGTVGPIHLDVARTYVVDEGSQRALEIDHGDALRVSRTFDLGVRPELFVEVGR
jgi:hypothetical protein